MSLKSLRNGIAIASLATAMSLGAAFAADEVFITDADMNIAINGYDPVAYHTEGAPTKGVAEFKAEYDGAVYKFSSADNKAAFEADPAKYAPAYGGWCTVGASKGKKIATQPEFFDIVDGQLYLNSSAGAHKLYLKQTSQTIDTADTNWTEIMSTPASDL
ncbi:MULTISPECIES: YHS domain-containing (seleno)protein [unclassified Dinoroseobacter]|uniref:YHS domain-containing (seleno)protein n=1 Tax=unclassified Dinoroseobacter TaxID=2620028 RepID=UPI003C7B0031